MSDNIGFALSGTSIKLARRPEAILSAPTRSQPPATSSSRCKPLRGDRANGHGSSGDRGSGGMLVAGVQYANSPAALEKQFRQSHYQPHKHRTHRGIRAAARPEHPASPAATVAASVISRPHILADPNTFVPRHGSPSYPVPPPPPPPGIRPSQAAVAAAVAAKGAVTDTTVGDSMAPAPLPGRTAWMTSVESVTSGTASNGAQATTAGDVGGPRRPTSAGSSSSAASTRREQAAAGLASAAERAAAMIPTPPQSPPLLSPSEDDLGQQSPEPTASARQYTAAPTVKTLKRAQSSKGSTDSQDSFYDWKVLRKQTHRRNVEQWGMEVIVIRRLRFLVDHLDELSGQHIPLLETLEASGVTAQQLHQYFPFVNTVHDLRLHLTTLLAERGPNAASSPSIPGSNAPRKLASEPHSGTQTACLPASTRHPYPAAVPSVSRRSYGHTTPLRTPMEVLKIVEAFRPVSESVARARTGARSHETHSGH